MSETDAEPSKIVVMPTMITCSTTLEEEMANMNAILEKLIRKSEKREAHIKPQEKKIAKLTKKLKKWSAQSPANDSESEDLGKVSIHI